MFVEKEKHNNIIKSDCFLSELTGKVDIPVQFYQADIVGVLDWVVLFMDSQ